MNAVKFLWILSILVVCSATKAKNKTKTKPETKVMTCPNQKVCNLEDVKCVTKGSNNAYKNAVVDPLNIAKIVGSSINGSANYTLLKIEIKGLKSCIIAQLAPNTTTQTFKCTKCCSKLVVNYIYQGRNSSGSFVNQTNSVTADDIVVRSAGDFGLYIGTDNLPHFSIKFESTTIEIRGNLTIDNPAPAPAPCDAVTKKPNNNTSPLTPTQMANIRTSFTIILRLAIRTIIEGVNTYCGKYPINAILPK